MFTKYPESEHKIDRFDKKKVPINLNNPRFF